MIDLLQLLASNQTSSLKINKNFHGKRGKKPPSFQYLDIFKQQTLETFLNHCLETQSCRILNTLTLITGN